MLNWLQVVNNKLRGKMKGTAKNKGSVRVWSEIHEQLKVQSRQTGRSIEHIVNSILLPHFENEINKGKKK